jgi:hypothetical protein
VRLGDVSALEPVTRLAAEIDCAVGTIVVNHARALTNQDGAGLEAVSEDLAAVGMQAAAGDAAEQARRIVREP